MRFTIPLYMILLSLPLAGSDGLIVFYSQEKGKRPEIRSIRPDGSASRDLFTTDALNPSWKVSDGAKWPRISPDGRRVAYYNYRQGGAIQNLVVMRLDGSDKREVTDSGRNSDPAWSPDGRRLVYRRVVDGRSGLWITDLAGGEPILLVNNPEMDRGPDWASTNRWIVFSSGYGSKRPGGEEIYVIKPDGTGLKRITESKGEDSLPKFSPDGTKIAFNSKRTGKTDIYIHDLASGEQKAVTDFGDAYAPSWSPDGKQLVFTRVNGGAFDLFIKDLAGGKTRQLTNGPATESTAWWGMPSVERARIAYQSPASGNDDIWIMDADGRNPYRLTESAKADRNPSWSPDGRTVYFESDRSGVWGIYVKPVTGGPARRITQEDLMDKYPSLSPDGSRFTGITVVDKVVRIFFCDVTGADRRFLEAPTGTFSSYPTLSPDNRRVAFASNRDVAIVHRGGENRALEIYLADVDGSNVTRLTRNEREDSLPAWSPDGKRLLYNSARSGQYHVHVIGADGSGDRPLTSGDHNNWGPNWAPDGKSFTFVSKRDGNAEIYRGYLDGRTPLRITRTPANEGSPVLWQPR
ncbi:MAG: hypothetical protein QNK37_32755 [Acidobacteriota bacterium]|nr:hypothetical protein [Acidobacteriota bacterium]